MNPTEEKALVLKAQAGDRDALGKLWDSITPKLFGYLINVLHDRQLAEDILQSSWLKAIKALPRFQPRGVTIDAWIFAIARNECRQCWRQHKAESLDQTPHDSSGNEHRTS